MATASLVTALKGLEIVKEVALKAYQEEAMRQSQTSSEGAIRGREASSAKDTRRVTGDRG